MTLKGRTERIGRKELTKWNSGRCDDAILKGEVVIGQGEATR